MKRRKRSHSKSRNEEDRLSDSPECVLLHILTFLNAKHAVRTCVLSTRWKDLWKRLPTLILHSSDFWTFKSFTNSSRASSPSATPRSHSSNSISSATAASSRSSSNGSSNTLFPKSLNLTALTTLHLQLFTFCKGDDADDDDMAEPFYACRRLCDLTIDYCTVKDARILCISSATLVSLTMRSDQSEDFYKIVLSTPNLCAFAFTGAPYQQLLGSNLSLLERVSIDAEIWSTSLESPLILLSWLLELANVKSLTVSASTLQVLFLIPELLNIKLPCLGNLKSLKEELKPLSPIFSMRLKAAKSWKAALKPSPRPMPDGIVDFLLQNSPSAKVDMIDFARSYKYIRAENLMDNR